MEGLKGLIDNPMVKSLLLKQLKSAWKKGSLTLITITEKEGELEINTYSEPMTVITKTDLQNIINSTE